MSVCRKVLQLYHSFYITIGDDYATNVKIIADELGLFMRDWTIWHYTFGQQTKTKFSRAYTNIIYFVSDRTNFTFNEYAVQVPLDRQLIYNDKRANPTGKIPDDIWNGYPRVCRTFKERTDWHSCQMPEILLKRIIAVSSNPDDCVLDLFSGSGTTAAHISIKKELYRRGNLRTVYRKFKSTSCPIEKSVQAAFFNYHRT